jgi:hypothetical protein
MKRRLRGLVKDPKHWRARAHEMRSAAAQVTDPRIKAATTGAADAYENLAQLCEAKKVISSGDCLRGEVQGVSSGQ